jgi:predicted dehydrogenase
VTPIRIGVIGIGFGQRAHVPAFSVAAGCEVVALCASTVQRATKVAERLGIPKAYGDWRALVDDPAIDAITIATPPDLQPDIALAALAQGKAVFCEKPLATSKAEAIQMAELAKKAGLANMLDFELPEIEAWRRAKTILDEDRVGPLRLISIEWHIETYANRMGLSSWKTDTGTGGGTLNAFVSHVFHYVEWFAGPVHELSARLFRAPGDVRTGDTVAVLCLELASGTPVSASVSSNSSLGSGHRVTFYGDEGTMVLDNACTDYARGFHLHYGTRLSNRLEDIDLSEDAGIPGADGRVPLVARIAGRFANWIRNGVPARPNFEDGLRVQSLLDAARRSDQSGCWVRGPF